MLPIRKIRYCETGKLRMSSRTHRKRRWDDLTSSSRHRRRHALDYAPSGISGSTSCARSSSDSCQPR
jgi:hypothetical protein